MQKEAIAIYYPKNDLEQIFQDTFHASHSRYMTSEEMGLILKSIPVFRALSTKIRTHPEETAKMLFSCKNTNQYWYYPCDILELRNLLTSKSIVWHAPIMLFSLNTVKRVMSQYPLCLAIDRRVARDGVDLGCIHMRRSNRLGLTDNLKSILLRNYLTDNQVDQVKNIIKQAYKDLPSYVVNDFPFTQTDEKVVASNDMFNLKKQAQTNGTIPEPFSVGEQPKLYADDEILLQKSPVLLSPNFKQGDRLSYRYRSLTYNSYGRSTSIPITKSLLEAPILCSVSKIESNGDFWILLDGQKEPKKVKFSNHIFFTKNNE